jgi:L-rhamnose mutarotase
MRVALHTRLKPGAEDAYEEAHREIPPALANSIRAAGATSWTIWRSGLDLFHVIECEDYGDLLAYLDARPLNQVWQEQMTLLLEVSHDYSRAGTAHTLPVVWQL